MDSKLTALAFGLATALAVPAALADEPATKESSTSTTTTTTEPTTAPPPNTTTTTTSSTYYEASPPPKDNVVIVDTKDDDKPRVRSGLGLNIFGAAGTNDSSKLGVGGRIEYVTAIGLTLGGSYTQHFGGSVSNNDLQKTSVRPLLGEIGWAIPLVRRAVEVRPMVGLGYAFMNATSDTNNTANSNQTASAAVATSGFDVAPGAKVSYLAKGFEVFTMPKYHIISGNNFFAMELGAGARF